MGQGEELGKENKGEDRKKKGQEMEKVNWVRDKGGGKGEGW